MFLVYYLSVKRRDLALVNEGLMHEGLYSFSVVHGLTMKLEVSKNRPTNLFFKRHFQDESDNSIVFH